MLPETGSISMSQVNTELKKTETSRISLNDSDVRKLAKVESGTIAMSDLRGKSNSEYVENYSLFHGAWTGNRNTGKTFSAQANIPHKIINGTITVNATLTGGRGNGSYKQTSLSVSNIPLEYGRNYYRGSKQFNNINLKTLDINGNTGFYYADPPSAQYFEATMTVDIKFTGEWEKE